MTSAPSGDARWGAVAAQQAAAVIRERTGATEPPVLGIILGSGLGDFVARIGDARVVPYADVPGFAPTSVVGHAGRVVAGRVAGRDVVVMAGRFHMYEGHSPQAAVFPVRVLHALGARAILATNAAGGLNTEFQPGQLVVIRDQLNLTGVNPLTGPVQPGDLRFPDMSAAYSPRLRTLLHGAAGGSLPDGVYAGLLGPAYETPAEVRMLQQLGADLTGMSTVAEAIVAAALGVEFAGVSLVTNAAAGLSDAPVRHDDVVDAGRQAASRFGDLVERFIAQI